MLYARPCLGGGSASELEYLEELVFFTCALKEWLRINEF